MTRTTENDIEEAASDRLHRLGEKGMAALDAAKEMGRKVQDRAIAGAHTTDQMIRKHPYESLGVAFGIGVLVGVLVSRR